MACKEGELLLAPGVRINGTVLFAQKAPDKYSRPRLVLDFSNVVCKDGRLSPLYARVLSVDNARETVRNNEILGIIQPHATRKMAVAMTAISAVNPIAGYTIKAIFDQIWQALIERHGKQSGTKQMIDLLKLSQIYGHSKLQQAIESALVTGCYDPAAVRHLLHREELQHVYCEAIHIGALERYARPLPVMHEYDQLLTAGGSQ